MSNDIELTQSIKLLATIRTGRTRKEKTILRAKNNSTPPERSVNVRAGYDMLINKSSTSLRFTPDVIKVYPRISLRFILEYHSGLSPNIINFYPRCY